MRISNINRVQTIFKFILVIQFFIMSTLIFLYDFNMISLYVIILLLIVFSVLCFLLFNLRYFKYEHTGEVISIKYFGTIFSRLIICTEFPAYKMQSFKISGHLFYKKLRIYIISETKGRIAINFFLLFITENQYLDLRNSLSHIEE